jgi:hypothetical protein
MNPSHIALNSGVLYIELMLNPEVWSSDRKRDAGTERSISRKIIGDISATAISSSFCLAAEHDHNQFQGIKMIVPGYFGIIVSLSGLHLAVIYCFILWTGWKQSRSGTDVNLPPSFHRQIS